VIEQTRQPEVGTFFIKILFLQNITSMSTNFVLNQIELKILYPVTNVNKPALGNRGVMSGKSSWVMLDPYQLHPV
jgi:hypothetical protein